jgi:hypothetical protein
LARTAALLDVTKLCRRSMYWALLLSSEIISVLLIAPFAV